MTITFANIPVLGGAKNADVPTFTLTDLSEVGYAESNNGLTKVRTYRLETGDSADETYVIVRREYDPSRDITRSSIRVITNVEDDTLDTPLVGEYEAVIAWNHPGSYILDVAQQLRMLAAAYSIVCGTFDGTSGEPAGDTLASMNFGGTKVVGA
jgi:hypothetical protein